MAQQAPPTFAFACFWTQRGTPQEPRTMMQKGDPFEELLELDAQSPSASTDARMAHAASTQQDDLHLESKPPAQAVMGPQGRARSKSQVDVQGKRKRHADAERERINRKQTGIHQMREEVAQLERHLHSLLSASSTGAADFRAQVVQDANHTQPGTDAKSLPRSGFDTSGIYARALADSDSLRREKSLLQAKLDNFELLEMTVKSRLHELTTETIRQPTPPAPRDATIEAIRQLSYRVVLSNECCDLMRDLMRQSNRFPIHANPSSHTDVTTTALGWSAVFQHDGNDVNFSLTKTFPTADLDELASSVWRAFHDIFVFQKIFSPSICIEVLQRISDDAFIIRWQIDCRKVGPYVRHCRNLIFRWKSSDGCYVGCRTINEVDPSVATSNATSEAFDQFYWAKFTQDRSGRGCEVAFAGRVGVGSGTSALARFLCAEIPISIFRWENMVVGPLFNFEPPSIV